NRGVVAGMNRGLAEARGDFLLFAAADDFVDPAIIERSMAAIAGRPDIGITFSDFAEALESGELSVRPQCLGDRPTILSPAAVVELSRRSTLSFHVGSVFFNRRWLLQA